MTVPAEYADRLWAALHGIDEGAAVRAVLDALDHGIAAESVLLDVIGHTQRRVGAEWAANRFTVAQEHAATAINDRALAAVVTAVGRPEPEHGSVLVSCIDGEWHALPARLLAEVLALRGFAVGYLGAQVPVAHLTEHVRQHRPQVVALSGSLATRLPSAHLGVIAVQNAGVSVVVGGGAFGPDGRWAAQLGAQGWAANAPMAADLLLRGSLGNRPPARQPVDDLPHLADQEYTMVINTAGELVKAGMAGLEDRFPAMREYTDDQRNRTAEDLAQIVEFLAAALYVDDRTLFSGFLTWTADILAARQVPPRSLHHALDVLAGELRDFPRATAILAHADASLRSHLG